MDPDIIKYYINARIELIMFLRPKFFMFVVLLSNPRDMPTLYQRWQKNKPVLKSWSSVIWGTYYRDSKSV